MSSCLTPRQVEVLTYFEDLLVGMKNNKRLIPYRLLVGDSEPMTGSIVVVSQGCAYERLVNGWVRPGVSLGHMRPWELVITESDDGRPWVVYYPGALEG